LGAAARRGDKQVTGASRFMERMPTFPEASMAEILDIRERLRPPLVRFRAAMIEIERMIDAAAHDQEFEQEIADLYLEKIAPSLRAIDEAMQDDKYLRQLAGALVGDVGAATAGVQAAWSSSEGKREVKRHQLFFLYKLGSLLGDGSSAHS
jgi:hypothetical protein